MPRRFGQRDEFLRAPRGPNSVPFGPLQTWDDSVAVGRTIAIRGGRSGVVTADWMPLAHEKF
jgi:hypothetical protein